jgi:hypothetical protein
MNYCDKGVKPERHRISGPEMLFTGTNNSTVQYSTVSVTRWLLLLLLLLLGSSSSSCLFYRHLNDIEIAGLDLVTFRSKKHKK